ncbi:hypothetical protein D1AOALGA4SA_261 [Olavius algarvensis Delta 1 endosymbiont]|nr:hypothetical protein D1AOALGA4SA_261 [Olavius algarvensis Delta 1 endosymbiont]
MKNQNLWNNNYIFKRLKSTYSKLMKFCDQYTYRHTGQGTY